MQDLRHKGQTSDEQARIMQRRIRWADALRSGEYKQATGKLRLITNPEYYCCLGVACKVFQDDLGITEKIKVHDAGYTYTADGDSSSLALPEPVREALGLSVFNMNVLVTLNDSGVNFGIIAAVITAMEIQVKE